MALDKQLIPVVFSGALDQKTTEELVVPGKFVRLENCRRNKIGKVEKRYGFSSLSNEILGGGTVQDGRKLDTFEEDLLLFSSTNLYSYSDARDYWADRGEVSSVQVTTTPAVTNNFIQTSPDTASYGGLVATVWEDSRGGIRASVEDTATGAYLLYDQEVTATGVRPRIFGVNGTFVIGYIRGTTLYTKTINSSSADTIGAEVTILANVVDAPWDLAVRDSTSAVFAINISGGDITVGYITYTGVLGSLSTSPPKPAAVSFTGAGTSAIAVVTAVGDTVPIYVAYADNSEIRVKSFSTNLLVSDDDLIETVANIKNITGAIYASTQARLFYEVGNPSTETAAKNQLIRTNTVTFNFASNTVGTAALFLRSVGLASKAFQLDDIIYVSVAHMSALQPTYFTVNDSGKAVAKVLPGLGGGLTQSTASTPSVLALRPSLPSVVVPTAGTYQTIFRNRNQLVADADGTVLSSYIGLSRTSMDFSAEAFRGSTLGKNYHISGGILLAYDGVSAVEHGFNLFPEDVTLAESTTGSGALTITTAYRVVALYEWVDAKGQVHRSAPSIPQTFTLTGANNTLTATVPTLRLTQKTGDRANCKIVTYRTVSAGTTVYYRDVEVTNDPTADTVSIVMVQNDTSLNVQEILYTVGGSLENIGAPACTVAVTHKNRLWLAGLEDGNTIAYSKEFVPGEGVAFSDLFTIQVDPRGGPVTALASMDDKLVIFKKNSIFTLVGDGPVDSGAQNDYGAPQLASPDVGCDYPDSVALSPTGLLFKSEKGIYQLTRALALEDTGASVEDFDDSPVSGAVVMGTEDEIRFTTSDGSTLVYNYYFDQWYTWTNYTAVSSTYALGSFLHLKSDGTVNREIQDQYNDNGAKIRMNIETSWLAVAGIQGYQRLYRFALIGEFLSHHTTRVKLAYDYEKVYTETVLFDTETGLGTDTYGTGVYGDTVFGGTGSDRYQFRCKPKRQKCEAIKFRIEDVDNIVAAGGGSVSLIALTLEAGIKSGLNKMGAAKSIGS